MICILNIGIKSKIWSQACDDSLALRKYSIFLKDNLELNKSINIDSALSNYKEQYLRTQSFTIRPLEMGFNLNYNSEDSLSLNNNKLNLDYNLTVGGEIFSIPYQFDLGSISQSSNKLSELNNFNFSLDVADFKDKILNNINSKIDNVKNADISKIEENAIPDFNFRDRIENERRRIFIKRNEIEKELSSSQDSSLLSSKNQLDSYLSSLDSLYDTHINYKDKLNKLYNTSINSSAKYKNQMLDKIFAVKGKAASKYKKMESKLLTPFLKTTEKINLGRQFGNNSSLASRYLPLKGLNYEGKIGDFGYKLMLGTPGFRSNKLFNGSSSKSTGFGINFNGSYRYVEVNHSLSDDVKQSMSLQIVKKDSVYNRESKNYNNQNGIIGYCIDANFKELGKLKVEFNKSELGNSNSELFNKIFKVDSSIINKIGFNSQYEVEIYKFLKPYLGFRWVGSNFDSWANELLLAGMKEIRTGIKGNIKNKLIYDFGFSRISPTQRLSSSSKRTFWNALVNYKIYNTLKVILNARPGVIETSNLQNKNVNSVQAFYSATLNYSPRIKKVNIQSLLNYSNNKTTFEVLDTTNYNGSNYLTFHNYITSGELRIGIVNQIIVYQNQWNVINTLDVAMIKKTYQIKVGIQKGSNYNLWRNSYGCSLELGLNTNSLNIYIANQVMTPEKDMVNRYLWQSNVGIRLNFYNLNKISK
ncbi:MAG: hypothetical protein HOP11_07915 [Saprospiraceae bacterium]|nr:hypothetical protein [Saprospiraceae bacterium]